MMHNLEAFLHGALIEQRPFNIQLRCYSAPFYQNADATKVNDLNNGGKIILPNSALDWLVRLNIQYPMMFKVTNPNPGTQRVTHCGVLEFMAEEGRCYLPSWMMRHLLLNEGQMGQIEYANLGMATYAKFKPQSSDFLNISNPRAVLEVELRKFACLTKGDLISVQYNGQVLEFLVVEVKPGNAVSIIECDMNVEFETPDDYVEEKKAGVSESGSPSIESNSTTVTAFGGRGFRLDGKNKTEEQQARQPLMIVQKTVSPHVHYRPGQLTFIRTVDYKRMDAGEKQREKAPKNGKFPGVGFTLRATRNN